MRSKSHLPSLWGEGRDVFPPFRSLHREIDRVFDEFTRAMPWSDEAKKDNGGYRFAPHIDMCETEGALEITAELPGVEENDIDVTVTDNVMTIKGEKKSETEKKEKDYHLVERSYGMFQRSLPLPYEVDADKVEAKFENGVLKVSMPKPPEIEAKTRKITVKS
ncbi:MAG: Hsp20/alpha crystallin family protein [Hyphomicrobiales bacterium]